MSPQSSYLPKPSGVEFYAKLTRASANPVPSSATHLVLSVCRASAKILASLAALCAKVMGSVAWYPGLRLLRSLTPGYHL